MEKIIPLQYIVSKAHKLVRPKSVQLIGGIFMVYVHLSIYWTRKWFVKKNVNGCLVYCPIFLTIALMPRVVNSSNVKTIFILEVYVVHCAWRAQNIFVHGVSFWNIICQDLFREKLFDEKKSVHYLSPTKLELLLKRLDSCSHPSICNVQRKVNIFCCLTPNVDLKAK